MINGFFRNSKVLFISFILSLGIFCFVNVSSVQAATYYVSTLGTDNTSHGTTTGTGAWLTIGYALTGNRINQGDALIIEAGTYEPASYFLVAIGAGSGDTIIRAADGATVNINIASGITSRMMYPVGSLYFKNINFTNTNSSNVDWMWIQYDGTITFENCTFDYNNVAAGTIAILNNAATNLIFKNCYIKNVGGSSSGHTFIISGTGTLADSITMQGCLVENVYRVIEVAAQETDITLTNNTFTKISGSVIVPPNTLDSFIVAKNNIFAVNDGANAFWILGTHATYLIGNPSKFDVTNNIFWSPTPTTSGHFNPILFASGRELIPLDKTNLFISPNFTNYAGGDYTLASGSLASGKGLVSVLPITDKNGNAWRGADVGCYTNPSPTSLVLTEDKVAFVGDSIMLGSGANSGSKCWEKFNENTNLTVVSGSNAAVGGLTVEGVRFLVDKVITEQTPDVVFVSIGVNNLLTSGTQSPTNLTAQQLANEVVEIFEKVINWGAIPIWLGVPSLTDNQAEPEVVDSLIASACSQNNWDCGSILAKMKLNANWATTYYDDLASNLHPNNAGHLSIAQTAESLYSPYTIGTNNVNISSNTRIYNNGKYRYRDIPSGTTSANINISPIGGWNVGDYSKFLDLAIDTWNNTDIYYKKWTESSASSTVVTSHTIGDLRPNQYYQVKVNDTITETLQADGSGQITFTYSGGYSSKTFEVEEVPTAPTIANPTVLSSSAIRWNFTDNSDNETGFKLYDSNGTLISTVAAENLSYIDETGLSASTIYTRYIKVYNSYGESSASSDATQSLGSPAVVIINTLPSSNQQQSNTNIPTVTFDKPISQMTREELLSKIAEITQAINQIKSLMPSNQSNTNLPSSIPSSFSFISNLKKGITDIAVKYLQMILNQNKDTQLAETGIGSLGNETTYFGSLTEKAVIKFQEKYKDSVLSPWNFTNGTGFVGKTTREKLNELINK